MVAETKITIQTFKAVTKAIAESENLEMVTNRLAQLLVSELLIKGCAIYILDSQSKELEMMASFGLRPKYLSKGTLSADKSLAANLTGKPVIVANVLKDENIQYPEEAKQEGITSIVSIPIIFMSEIIGAMRLYHYEEWNVSEEDLDSLQLLAENVGLAMSYTSLCNAIDSISEVIHSVGSGKCPSYWGGFEEEDA